MLFSPSVIPYLIIEPLRYFFSRYANDKKLFWDKDEKKRTVDIDHINNFFKVALEQRPRVLVDRGPYSTSKVGLTDNLAEQKSFSETNGLKDRINMTLYSGASPILIEARNMGTCEILSDMVCHYLTWARPEICDTQGFKDFAGSISVSPCQVVEKENTEKFQVQVQIPWIKEEHWRVRDDGIILKNTLMNLLAQ